jgi:ABC-type arginine transport system permease subunit
LFSLAAARINFFSAGFLNSSVLYNFYVAKIFSGAFEQLVRIGQRCSAQ